MNAYTIEEKPSHVSDRIEVPFDKFLELVNDPNAKVWDYRTFVGIESVETMNEAKQTLKTIGLVVTIYFELVKEGAPECPEASAHGPYFAYIDKWVQKYEAHFKRAVGTPS